MNTALPKQGLKLYAPKIRGRLITRHRLIKLLDFDSDRSLLIVSAPAGYGKSTTVAQWVSHQNSRSVWLTVDRRDRNLHGFLTLLAEGLRDADSNLVPVTFSILGGGFDSHDALLNGLLEDLSRVDEPVIIVVDDYHLIESTEINAVIAELYERLPRQLRLVLITHKTPALPLARLRASGELLELDATDLRFDRDETAAFLMSRGHELPDEDLERIFVTTEGWIAALNLASMAIKRLPERETADAVASMETSDLPWLNHYLWQEVIDQVSGEMQSFLFRVSILDKFTEDLCNATLRSQDAARWIALCEEENLFISSIGPDRTWFRFHPLFLSVLRQQLDLKYSRSQIRQLHMRASRWYQAHGFMRHAIRHALVAGDSKHGATMLEANTALLFETDQNVELYTWLKDIDTSVLEGNPRLAFYLSWAQLRLGYWREAESTITIAESAYEKSMDSSGSGSVELWRALFAWRGGHNLSAICLYQKALDHLSEERVTERTLASIGLGMAYSYHGDVNGAQRVFTSIRHHMNLQENPWLWQLEAVHSGYVLYLQGELQAAAQVIGEAVAQTNDRSNQVWIQAARIYLGLIAIEQDRLGDAEMHLQDAERRCQTVGGATWRERVLIARARLLRAQGRNDQALETLRLAIEGSAAGHLTLQLREARAIEAEIAISSHQLVLAERWLEPSQDSPDAIPAYEYQAKLLVSARYLIAVGRAMEAIPLLARLHDDALASGRNGQAIEVGVVTALALKESGDMAGAVSCLQNAVTLGSRLGFVQVFLKDWEALAPLLRNIAQRERTPGYATTLIVRQDGPPTPPHLSEPGGVDGISPREIEVLRLVALGKSNREIGLHLYISEKTVKKHVSNIMAKLGTSNRTQTADLARHMNLV